MNRDFSWLNIFLNRLQNDVYAQPEDTGHTQLATDVFVKWITRLDVKSVLDMGCGDTAFMQKYFEEIGICYTGVGFSKQAGIVNKDFTFTGLGDDYADLIWARHSLEHSPMPVITLMEWSRLAKFLCLINPNPTHYGYVGRNHYSVANRDQLAAWLQRAGWHIIWEDKSEPSEIRLMCERKEHNHEFYSSPLDYPMDWQQK